MTIDDIVSLIAVFLFAFFLVLLCVSMNSRNYRPPVLRLPGPRSTPPPSPPPKKHCCCCCCRCRNLR